MSKLLIQKTKDSLKGLKPDPLKRSQKYGLNTVLSVIFVLGIVIFLGILSYRHSKEFDLTTDKRFSLSPQTINILESIEGEVSVIAFFASDDPVKDAMADLLDRYKSAAHGRFQYRFVDPILRPGDAKEYNVEVYNTVVFIYGDRTERIALTEQDIYASGEQEFTNALLKVTSTEPKHIYFLTKHGEYSINDDFSTVKSSLESENYEIYELNLLNTPAVPDDAAILVVAGPRTNLFDVEIESIDEYLNRGGGLLVMIDPGVTATRLETFLGSMGVELGDDLILDPQSRIFGGDYTIPMVDGYYPHAITESFTIPSFFPYARSVTVDAEAAADSGWSSHYLALTSEYSWAEKDLKTKPFKYNEGRDTAGPVPVAVVGTKFLVVDTEETADEDTEPTPEARVVIFGNAGFAANSFFYVQGNRELFLNTINWLADEEELIAIGPKDRTMDLLTMNRVQGNLFFIISVLLLPTMVLVVGVLVTLRRRWKE
jgi:ABC-type uncharacterized transport system involved in gliding motility auxiliary subunit